MNKLWLGFAAIAAYGSVYPFDFQFRDLDPAAWQAFVDTCCRETSRGDILGNVVLFLPFGYLGVLAARPETRLTRQFVMVCLLGVVFAFLLQVAQLYLPSRDENLQDVIWNLLGIVVGGALGIPSRHVVRRAADHATGLQLVPWILIGSWLSYRLIPFVPSIDFQSIKDAVKPLLDPGSLTLAGTAYTTVAWLIVGYLLNGALQGKRLGRFLPIVVLGSFGLEILIVFNLLTPSNVAAGLTAIVLHWAVFNRLKRVELPLLLCLLATLAWDSLTPLTLRAEAASFNWLPFQGFLGGSMFVNAQSAAEKVFAYGSIVYLLLRMGAGSWTSLLAAAAWVAGIEFAQTYIVNTTPEITDPLLVTFAALSIFALEGLAAQKSRQPAPSSGAGSGLPSGPRDANRMRSDSGAPGHHRQKHRRMIQKVNLNARQTELLDQLAREMGLSVSEASNKIIADAIEEARRDAGTPDGLIRRLRDLNLRGPAGLMAQENERGGWLSHDIALQPEHYEILQELSSESGSSVSRVVRRIIDHFFGQLEAEAD